MKNLHSLDTKSIVKDTFAMILAGGSGTRLQSLTKWHSKPSIPFGGKFRTIDFPLSNCINSDIRKIGILTQYKSHSLNTHIQKGWNFLRPELGEFIDLIPAQQRVKNAWYQGTADAIYQNIDIIEQIDPKYILVLAGDHIYKMDYSEMILAHAKKGADMTIGCIEVPKDVANQFGVMDVNRKLQVTGFVEKPINPPTMPGKKDACLASMGIYVFNKEFLFECLNVDSSIVGSTHDFGKDIIPAKVSSSKMYAFEFKDRNSGQIGYWRDVGTIDSYFDANMDLLSVTPGLNLYDEHWPIWTYQSQLPPAKFVFDDDDRRGSAVDSLVSGGCIISGSQVKHSLLSNNVRIHSFSEINNCIILPNSTIGRNCRLNNVIIDQNCHIPSGTVIGADKALDARFYYVSPKGITLVSQEMINKKQDELNCVA